MVKDTGETVKIALLGCGVVGGGVLRLLRENQAAFAARVGGDLEVRHVLVRDPQKPRVAECDPATVTTDPEVIYSDDEVDLVVELIGGEEPALSLVEGALRAKKSVVTANKFLIARHGPRLLELAVEQGADLAFEASVGGGIPIIRTLRDALASDSIESVHGILNGTCNFILTRMRTGGVGFETALAEAQQKGYAEADPTLDVDGHDAAQKLVVTSMLAFGAKSAIEQVPVEGIRSIDQTDFAFADRFGFTIKHLAIGRDMGDRLSLRAHPTLVPEGSVLANIDGVLNGVYLIGRALGPCLLMGPGAGDMPTAVSVVADIVDVARSRLQGESGLATGSIKPRERPVEAMGELVTRYYLRFEVADSPGVLGVIASELGTHGVSIEQMVQQTPDDTQARAQILIITHQCRESALQEALQSIARQAFMGAPPRLLRIEDL